jgi:DNA-binding beta-propeller fold protein YncE
MVPPPEHEEEGRYLAPVVTGQYLWTANPLSGRVALIDASTLRVTLDTAGNGPTEVVGLPALGDRHGALVLNERSDDATLFRLDAAGKLEKRPRLRTHAEANAWVVSPSGRWAIAWTDARKLARVDPLETLQDITLLSLESEQSFALSVGARPSAFVFDAAEGHFYAVTEEGISGVELTDPPRVTSLIALSEDPLADASTRDVSFAPDGSYALVRTHGKSSIGVIELAAEIRTNIELGGLVTDADLNHDGSRAFAVLGPSSEVVVVPIPPNDEGFARVQLSGEAVGAIALNADASAAVVYSTVLGSTRVTLLDTREGPAFLSYRTQDLISPISALFAAPDPRFAVGFQNPLAGSTKAGAFSLISLHAARSPKIVASDAKPSQIAFAPDGKTALITVRSDDRKAYGAYRVLLENQQADFISLGNPPVAAGIVEAARRAYVAQSHPEGCITFLSLDAEGVETLAGFELSAGIRE